MVAVLVLNGSLTSEGDTKMAVAAAAAMSSRARVRVLSVPGPAATAFRDRSLDVDVAPSNEKAIHVAWMTAATFAAAVSDSQLCIYTYDRTFAADIALNCTSLLKRRCFFHVGTPFVVRKSRRYALAQKHAELWHISQFTKDEAERRGLSGGRVIVNCLADPAPDLTREQAAERSGVEGRLSAVIVGRLSPFKGQETFIRAFRVLKERGVNLRGYIVGCDTGEDQYDTSPSPDYRGYLQALVEDLGVSDRVKLLGKRPGHAAFRAADIACALSDDEPFGLVIAEAARASCPIVATHAGAFPEIVEHGSTGLLVPRRDPVAAAEALAELARNTEKRMRLAWRARTELVPYLSFERFRDDVIRALHGPV